MTQIHALTKVVIVAGQHTKNESNVLSIYIGYIVLSQMQTSFI